MALDKHSETLADLELAINPGDQGPVAMIDLFKIIYEGFKTFHVQILDVQSKWENQNFTCWNQKFRRQKQILTRHFQKYERP